MVFVDISGFTALSERLARRGKIGAELMRDTLNVVFMALLDEAYDYGAGLLKWGGDALLLLFDGPRHEERACRAAWEMQRTLDRVGRLKAGGGTVTLRMSVGITTRDVPVLHGRERAPRAPDRGARRDGDRGNGIDRRRRGDRRSAPLSQRGSTPRCWLVTRTPRLLLAAPPAVERKRAPDIGDVSGIDIPACIPIAARAHVLLERSEPEHRTITAAFIDLMDTDELLRELGLDGLGRRPRSAAAVDPGGCARLRRAVLRVGRRQGERQGAPHRRRAIEHGPRRGADAPCDAGDHGHLRRRAAADRREHGQGLHRRLRSALPPVLPGVR